MEDVWRTKMPKRKNDNVNCNEKAIYARYKSGKFTMRRRLSRGES